MRTAEYYPAAGLSVAGRFVLTLHPLYVVSLRLGSQQGRVSVYRQNRLKARLRAGAPALGCWLFMGSPVVSELLALAGFDGLIIDQEHAPGGLETGIHQMRAIQATPTTALLRVTDNQPLYFKQALDAGAEGILVANVESAEQAAAAVSACRYPPDGIRGHQTGASRASDWGFLAAQEYYGSWQDNFLLALLIESAQGVAAIPEICALSEVDLLFIGPTDLSGSIGAARDFDSPQFKELLAEAERRILEGGKWLGGVTVPGDTPAGQFARGYHFVTNCNDVSLLRDGARQAVAQRGV